MNIDRRIKILWPIYKSFPFGSAGKESTCDVGYLGSIPGLGRFHGVGKGYPLQYSRLENSMDCIDQGVTKNWTQLNDFYFSFSLSLEVLNWPHRGTGHDCWGHIWSWLYKITKSRWKQNKNTHPLSPPPPHSQIAKRQTWEAKIHCRSRAWDQARITAKCNSKGVAESRSPV